MSRTVFALLFLALVLQPSQGQVFSHGIPASVVSPTPDGQTHGIPASVVSPTPRPFGVNPPLRSGVRIQGPLRRFGGFRNRKQVFIPVPLFYSYYTDGFSSPADPYISSPAAPAEDPAYEVQAERANNDEDVRAAYLQGARDALKQREDTRYGEHYLDSREHERRSPPPEPRKTERSKRDEEAELPPVEDKSPATVFIFKDGHQLETRNYAIMSGTLFDFSGKGLKKIELGEIDAAATTKANDDRGVVVKLQ